MVHPFYYAIAPSFPLPHSPTSYIQVGSFPPTRGIVCLLWLTESMQHFSRNKHESVLKYLRIDINLHPELVPMWWFAASD